MRTLQENINQVNSDFNAIKTKIIESGSEVADGTKTEEYAAKVGKVYEAGKKAEYDAFWDTFQLNGTRTDYANAFAGYGWAGKIFYPKYDMKPTTAYMMFRYFDYTHSRNSFDLAQRLEDLGIEMDFSNCSTFNYMFYAAQIKRIPTISVLNATGLTDTFAHSSCETIDKIILKSDGSNTFSGTFTSCSYLKNIVIEGVIGKAFDIHWSTMLSNASITSIINALSTTTSGLTVSFSNKAVEAAFTEDEWSTLIATKPKWTISRVSGG